MFVAKVVRGSVTGYFLRRMARDVGGWGPAWTVCTDASDASKWDRPPNVRDTFRYWSDDPQRDIEIVEIRTQTDAPVPVDSPSNGPTVWERLDSDTV